MSAVDGNPSGEVPPQFLYSKFEQGIFWITHANEPSKVWLMRAISGLGELWEGVELTVVNSKDPPKRPRVLVRIPDTLEVTTVMTGLGIQNPELNMTDWSVMSHKVTEKEQILAFCIDPDSLMGSTLTAEVVAGCPQGGVLSPLLWNLVVDRLLVVTNDRGFSTSGYADDIVIIVQGKYEHTVREVP
jgi:hypothetical protein